MRRFLILIQLFFCPWAAPKTLITFKLSPNFFLPTSAQSPQRTTPSPPAPPPPHTHTHFLLLFTFSFWPSLLFLYFSICGWRRGWGMIRWERDGATSCEMRAARATFNTLKCRNFGWFFAHKTILMLVVPWGAGSTEKPPSTPPPTAEKKVKWKVLLALQTRRFSSAAFGNASDFRAVSRVFRRTVVGECAGVCMYIYICK